MNVSDRQHKKYDLGCSKGSHRYLTGLQCLHSKKIKVTFATIYKARIIEKKISLLVRYLYNNSFSRFLAVKANIPSMYCANDV